jgi:uncharacterized LabA/DUF88 family protein
LYHLVKARSNIFTAKILDRTKMNIAILVDYDNLMLNQKAAGLVDVATRVLTQLPPLAAKERGGCEMRLYGGWYEGAILTKVAQDLSVEIQAEFPKIIRVPNQSGGLTPISVNASLAVALSEDPAHLLFNTFRKKGKPNNIRVQSPEDAGCAKNDCALTSLKKFLKNGKCPNASCTTTSSNLVYRSEQKLVDTMLACDLLHSQMQNLDYIVLVSDDDDFIPPVRTLLLRGAPIVRAHPKFSSQRQNIAAGVARLHEMEL